MLILILSIITSVPSVPRRVANVTSFNVTQHSAAIGWTVAYLEYTPEEYKVHYNKSESESMISSEKRGIGSNFTLPLNLPLNITISMLSPGTEYTYYINAINSIGSTQTDIHSFTTVESCKCTLPCYMLDTPHSVFVVSSAW